VSEDTVEENTEALKTVKPRKTPITPEPVKTIKVEAVQSFGSAETGDIRRGEQAVLTRSKTVTSLVNAGYLLEVK
jgi:hypothetical protein